MPHMASQVAEGSMQEAVQGYYRTAIPHREDAIISHMEELRAGWESEIHFLDVTYTADGDTCHEQRVLRLFPGEAGVVKATEEYASLARLHTLGYPVPQVYALATNLSVLPDPFMIMERVPGTPLWRTLIHESRGQRQEKLLDLFCERFVELHRLDWRAYLGERYDPRYEEDGYALRVAIEELTNWAETGQLASFSAALTWIERRRDAVPAHAPAVVHFDFHPDNILLGADDRTVVLDWTQARVSDPRLDLAWTLVVVGEAEGSAWRDRILSCYERLSGETYGEIGYFEACACLKRLGIVDLVLQGGGSSLGLRTDIGDILRRQKPALRGVYERLVSLTGQHISDIEAFLDEP